MLTKEMHVFRNEEQYGDWPAIFEARVLRSFCGFVTAKFATWEISNASHDCFLSIFQSAASFWAPGFTHDHKLEDDHPSKL